MLLSRHPRNMGANSFLYTQLSHSTKNGEMVVGVQGPHDEMIQRHNSYLESFITFLTLMSFSSIPVRLSGGHFSGRETAGSSARLCARLDLEDGGQNPALKVSDLPAEGKEEPVTCSGYCYAIALP